MAESKLERSLENCPDCGARPMLLCFDLVGVPIRGIVACENDRCRTKPKMSVGGRGCVAAAGAAWNAFASYTVGPQRSQGRAQLSAAPALRSHVQRKPGGDRLRTRRGLLR